MTQDQDTLSYPSVFLIYGTNLMQCRNRTRVRVQAIALTSASKTTHK